MSKATTKQRESIWWKLHIDWPLLIGLLAVLILGGFILYSASGESRAMVTRQGMRILLAIVVMIVLAQFPPDTYRRWAPPLFLAGFMMLVAVLIIGHIGKGAQRWLNLGLFKFQPSEIMKIAVPLMVSRFVSQHPLPIRFKNLLIGLAIALSPPLLIAKQPDLGTALLVAVSGIVVLFLAGMSWRLVLAALVAVASFIPVLWFFLMHEYQRQRVLTFLHPESDPLGAGYHIIQSKIAIGSGGIFGKGWMHGTQSQLDFIPERHTDFIFAVFSEEFGLIGVSILLLLYFYIIGRGLYIAIQGQNAFERLLAGSITLTFFVYVFVNIGMVSGLLPVVGVPLPLVSYGGTSIVTLLAGFGMLMSIQTHKKFYAQ
ncbi:rod shape-determining protein RodA [Celerinatantimonas diazotrophica]|uniref:Peptidoglycan glycosyltransferase MrdB n=1 Tax=Celerinatantimonas diazotrophica TaxID=412034 RepID=A0A4R1K3I5_9GAMM|nr:rod shape-determining protein RodA [Celerinatantimonas diazotrophica]TCK58646.1 cell elongation-specific peptidoglycan biosynthesis regulator RodA [Celerinatantimonas diazotrophica]CAG9297275.1 Peptidoglycan glycosyltransferase MrdB [Celerinatantimonas diazotrophica]